MPAKRDVSPILAAFREFCANRKFINQHRFRDEIVKRSQPPPKLPEGPSAKLSNNYYFSRDARGLVKPDKVLVDGNTTLKLTEGGEKPATAIGRVPGKINNWDI